MRVLDKNEINEVSGGGLKGLLFFKASLLSRLFSFKKPAPAPAPKHKHY